MKKKNPNNRKLRLDKKQIVRLQQQEAHAIQGGSFTLINDTALASGASRCCPLQSAFGCNTVTISG